MSKVIIVGAGIMGLSTAYYLNQAGIEVEIIEQFDLDQNCSTGNAGMIVPSHFVPLAAPGMLAKGVKWMFNSKSPFYVNPSLNPSLIQWGYKFWKNANQKHIIQSAKPLKDLHLYSRSLYEELASQPDFDFGLQRKGILMLYKTETVAREEEALANNARELALDVNNLNAQEVQALEPNVKLDVLGGIHYKCDAHLSPNDLIKQFAKYLQSKGVKIHYHQAITKISTLSGKITALYAENREFKADCFVMAAGAYLPKLAALANIDISLMPGKGYSFMYNPITALNYPALLLEAKVAVTPMQGKIRFGGTMEIAPIQHHINMKRIQGIIEAIPQYYPDFKMDIPQIKDIWHGFRPCSPDGLPYLGKVSKFSNLYLTGGHGMMGISLGPASGKVICDLILGKTPSVSIEKFSPNR